MSQFFYVYVPAGAKGNLQIGRRDGIWGWKSSALDKHISSVGMSARSLAEEIRTGDYLVLGHGGPNSRVQPGGWAASVLKEVTFTEVTSTLYRAGDPVWPDDVYPERIRFNILDRLENVGGAHLGPHVMEALRLSANVGGVPILDAPVDVITLEAETRDDSGTTEDPADDDVSDQILGIDGHVDAFARVMVRREQKKIRRKKFGHRLELNCDLCGRLLPRRFVRAAHIKRRAVADQNERKALANIMAACLFGCDELFEHGYVYVDLDGRVQVNQLNHGHATPDLLALAAPLGGRTCPAATQNSAQFFGWHRDWATGNHAGPTA